MNTYKIPLFLAYKLHFTNKDFLLFDYDINNKITNYKLTDDLKRYKNKYSTFRVISCINKQITNNLKIY